MSQFSLFDYEPKDEPKDEPYDYEINDVINYKNGVNYVCIGIVLDRKKDGKYKRYRVRALRDKPEHYSFGYSEQWIWDFQIIK